MSFGSWPDFLLKNSFGELQDGHLRSNLQRATGQLKSRQSGLISSREIQTRTENAPGYEAIECRFEAASIRTDSWSAPAPS